MEDLLFVFPLFVLAIVAVMLASLWVIYKKAGQEGWAAIVPIYNYIVLLKIVNQLGGYFSF